VADQTNELAESVLAPYRAAQEEQSKIAKNRRIRQAKFFFGCSVALLTAYSMFIVNRYFEHEKFDLVSIVALLALMAAVRNSWRAI